MFKRIGIFAAILLMWTAFCLQLISPAFAQTPPEPSKPTLVIAAVVSPAAPDSPTKATSNGVWIFSYKWTQGDGIAPGTAYNAITAQLCKPDGTPVTSAWIIPQDQITDDGKSAKEGTTYTFEATAGLFFVKMPYDLPISAGRPLEPDPTKPESHRVHTQDSMLVYWPDLTASYNSDGNAYDSYTLRINITWNSVPADPTADPPVEGTPGTTISSEKSDKVFTIVDSFDIYNYTYPINPYDDRLPGIYGGIYGDAEAFFGYDAFPKDLNTDPITTLAPGTVYDPTALNLRYEGAEDPRNPDDGTSSTTYIFRVMYYNWANMPPQSYNLSYNYSTGQFDDNSLPWLRKTYGTGTQPQRRWYVNSFDWWHGNHVRDNEYNNVMLYMSPRDPVNKPDYFDAYKSNYIALNMMKDDITDKNYADGAIYKFVLEPRFWNGYMAAPIGHYKYFFGASDDTLPFWALEGPPYTRGDLKERDYHYYNNNIYISMGNSYNFIDIYNQDNSYADVVKYQPGAQIYKAPGVGEILPTLDMTAGYNRSGYTSLYRPGGADWSEPDGNTLSATLHPNITLGLNGPDVYNEGNYAYNYTYNGWYGFYLSNTESSYYCLYGKNMTDAGHFGTIRPIKAIIHPQFREPSVGATSETELNFQIEYSQIDGITPETDANGNTNAGGLIRVYIADSKDMLTNCRPYPLKRTDVLGTDPKVGVMYQTSTPVRLTTGTHYYYFETRDGQKTAKWPVDGTTLDPRIIFINNKPTLSAGSVTPNTGKAGDPFLFSVTYTDKDNQRPLNTILHVEYGIDPITHAPLIEDHQMSKADPTDTNYTDGCVYTFNSANLAHKLTPGWRRFCFEFQDNWGWRDDPNSQVSGETVYWSGSMSYAKPAPDSWFQGPNIGVNNRPVLNGGVVKSEDGTSNPATFWTYSVIYKDTDNDAPAYMNVYIGIPTMVDGEVTSITWDYGNPMVEAAKTDVLFSDGKEYVYQTRLPSTAPGDIFYYAFVGSDGIDNAVYNATTSKSANAIWDPVETINQTGPGVKVFQALHTPIVGEIPNNIVDKLYQFPIVYDASGTQLSYLPVVSTPGDPAVPQYTVDYVNGKITVAAETPNITTQYWFGTQGPTVKDYNTPPKLTSGTVTPNPGSQKDDFVFSVVYTDPDGLLGQAPAFIRLILDNITYDLEQAFNGALDYRGGVKFQTSLSLPLGAHHYYFEASDGTAYAIFDANGGRQSGDDEVIKQFVQISGPYVNDLPLLPTGAVFPKDTIDVSQAVTYTVKYSDSGNEPPNMGYPVVYIDNHNEVDRGGKITGISDTTITDDNKSWIPNEFKGMPLQITSGPSIGAIFRVDSNTSDTITLYSAKGPVSGSAAIDTTFEVGKLMMTKQDLTDVDYTDGMDYVVIVPSLGVNTNGTTHSAHFKSITTESIGDGATRLSIARYPQSQEIEGPTVINVVPAGNLSPYLRLPSVTPKSGKSTDEYTFGITYIDPDNDPPTLHEGAFGGQVQGYMRLIIDDNTTDKKIIDMVGPAMPNYMTGEAFTCKVSGLTPGIHHYYFQASDGYYFAKDPANYYTLSVNRQPVLSLQSVTPTLGNTGQQFVYSVKYTDLDVTPPSSIKLWIDSMAGIDISAGGSGTNYAAGVVYSYSLPVGTLAVGPHKYHFTASDGQESANQTADINMPTVHVNNAPTLSDDSVSPTNGWSDDTYTYSAKYKDPDGDAPLFVKVYIDGTAESNAFTMQKVGSSTDYMLGVVYEYNKDGLSAGNSHTYFFKASDSLDTAVLPSSGTRSGPSVVVRPSATITIACSASPRVGQPVTISGTIDPSYASPLTLQITKPNASVSQVTVNTQASGAYSYVFTPDAVGNWKYKTTWAGGGNYIASSSPEITVAVGGPTFTINGLGMISLPINSNSGFPDAVLGTDPGFSLAIWVPASNLYKVYSLLPGTATDFDFPMMAAGQGYWIKTLVPKTISPNGTVVSTTSNFTVALSAGWNMIGDPFLNRVLWGSLKIKYNGQTVSLATAHVNGWVREYGWMYDQASGSYKLVDAKRDDPSGGPAQRYMEPWYGYWLRTLVPCTLVITPPSAAQTSGTSAVSALGNDKITASTAGNHASGWQVRIGAQNGNLKSGVFIGKSSGDAERMESPLCIENFVHAYITDENSGIYASDIRSKVSAGETWMMKVITDIPGEVSINWEGLSAVPSNIQLFLIDSETGTKVDLKQDKSYKFLTQKGDMDRSFRIVAEKK